IREVEVEQVDKTFYEDTLLPLSLAAQIGGRSYAVTMPRYINENRVPTWGQYAILRDRIIYPGADSLITDPDFPIWVDTTVQHPSENLQRGLVWHTWG
ncbi:MAG: hypothetical protein K8I82_17805, partial [Anaerolineae bacterium]|nr:hypothetical protein [Anaerolineae bacterium]